MITAIWTSTSTAGPVKMEKIYSQAELLHPNPGCSENSQCDKIMGKHRSQWLDLIHQLKQTKTGPQQQLSSQLEHFRKKRGIPIGFYTQEKTISTFSPMLWDSPCRFHQAKGKKNKILLGESFIVDIKNNLAKVNLLGKNQMIPMGPQLQLDPVFIIDKDQAKAQSIKNYFVPRGEIPTSISGDHLNLMRDEEGLYYTLQVSSSGEFNITANEQNDTYPTSEIDCPKLSKNEFISIEKYQQYYQSVFCREIIDKETNTPKIMMLMWSCI